LKSLAHPRVPPERAGNILDQELCSRASRKERQCLGRAEVLLVVPGPCECPVKGDESTFRQKRKKVLHSDDDRLGPCLPIQNPRHLIESRLGAGIKREPPTQTAALPPPRPQGRSTIRTRPGVSGHRYR